ncbi:MAG: hypothetical protein A2878_03140 [Candidatus Moranbacteria bacterium RIFCSPHIGHO2_01_FULL_54_31]|nr:MAG: hypothetical protein A2878_03140 [Candidatus Moranbacteria bacterium RIFCSPHIGHO2_01_FULL_54_31]
MLKVKIILGSTRAGRQGDKPAQFVHTLAKERADWEVELLDLKEWDMPLAMSAKPPKSGEYDDEMTKKWAAVIGEADAYIIVTPEYNHGYPAVLKNALDRIYNEWLNKPVAFVGYGAMLGGGRAVEQLRQVAIELQMAPIREAVFVPLVWQAFDESGKPANEQLTAGAQVMFAQLTWWGEALKAAREKK